MLRRAWLTAMSAASLLCACEAPQFPRETPASVVARRVTPEDTTVFDAVLHHFQRNEVLVASPAPPPPPGAPAPPARDPRKLKAKLLDHTRRAGFDALSADGWLDASNRRLPPLRIPEEAVRGFRARNRERTTLERYDPRDLDVEWTADAMGSLLSGAVLSLTLPGYSDSGDEALIELSIYGPSMSGGGELLLMRKTAGVWRVVARRPTWIS